ncbi:MAG TPA: hypothetical protein VF276_05465 [Chloroflexia bacterium]
MSPPAPGSATATGAATGVQDSTMAPAAGQRPAAAAQFQGHYRPGRAAGARVRVLVGHPGGPDRPAPQEAGYVNKGRLRGLT